MKSLKENEIAYSGFPMSTQPADCVINMVITALRTSFGHEETGPDINELIHIMGYE